VFDLRKLLSIPSIQRRRGVPVVFDIKKDLTAWYSGFGSSHNIVSHEATNMIFAVGTRSPATCRGGLYMLDVSDPSKPTSPGCVSQDGYVHDAQCVIYTGPDEKYRDHEICFNYNEDTLTIVDITDKAAPIQISRTGYPSAAYTHQGWLLDSKMEYLLMDDEEDELKHTGIAANNHTTTYIWDVKSLVAPVKTGVYQSPAKSIDHNQYVVDGLSYQSNYGSGLRVVDVSSIAEDPSGKNVHEVAFFDIYPEDDDVNGMVDFNGSWSVYPYFRSGYILLNTIERGIFALKLNR
jgi:choice-of-anchor B domain-containing protein